MRRFLLPLLAVTALSACDPQTLLSNLDEVEEPEISCATRPGGGCLFSLNPLRVLPDPVTLPRRPYTFFRTADELRFVDARGRLWVAPRRTLTDGASIPKIFTAIVGDPTTPEFINTAAVHDAYCGVGNELAQNFHQGRWQDVHRMFYDGLVVGGVEPITAKLMFAAVWLGGPRWNTQYRLDHVPSARRQQSMRQTKAYIEKNRPTMPQLLAYLEKQQRILLGEYPFPPSEAEERVEEVYEEEYEEEVHEEDPVEEVVEDPPVVVGEGGALEPSQGGPE